MPYDRDPIEAGARMQDAIANEHIVAATLALDVKEARPGIGDEAAAAVAWKVLAPHFPAVPSTPLAALIHVMAEIRAGRIQRVEHSSGLTDRAVTLLKHA
jgi:hypothetical protein